MTIALIDGDVMAYQACYTRYERTANNVDGVQRIQLDADGKRVPLEFTTEEDSRYLRTCWENFKKNVGLVCDRFYCSEVLIAIKGRDNYRDLLYPEYKLPRVNSDNSGKLAPFVKNIRNLAEFELEAVPAHGREADDLLRIWSNEARAAGQDFIVFSNDKDLRCIPGKHFIVNFDKTKEALIEVSEHDARVNYYTQLLKGDMTDNIPGLPGIGPAKASSRVADCITDADFQEVVVGSYIEFYDDQWYDYFLSNGKLIHIQNHLDDYFDCSDWPIVQELRP